MKRSKLEKTILICLYIFGISFLVKIIRKPPIKDWVLIFLFKGYTASILDILLVKEGVIKYPVNLYKKLNISFLFDYLLFPVTCVYYNQLTLHSNIYLIFLKSLYFSVPMTLMEHLIEKNTALIKYKKSWNSFYSLITITLTFLISRLFIGLVRDKSSTSNNK
ncbi:CBO0543 family protein [Niallia sp. NCCP-28]|uniref:CBO0543 family protein n=1 Tax=Niallia sp. NCCP-28 TaxID=2934712 RepID=UPI00208906F6|nr:CBO0543 family protein [Niallia sp. NCCP-28]GKU82703.1 hypothetical protein NCCP28_20990 [Niallia sp. NCCP-28]